MQVTVIGTGYVGTVTGACLAYLGHDVICVDVDARKIDSLRRGQLPLYEPHLDELLKLDRERNRIEFTTELNAAVRNSDVIFIAVGTPSMPSGEANLEYLEAAARGIGAAMDATKQRVVVNKSTVPVGSGNLVEALVRDGMEEGGVADSENVSFAVVSNPEFLREGCAIADTLYGDRIVVGSDNAEALEMMADLYRPLLDQTFAAPAFLPRPLGFQKIPLVVTSLTSAEMIKYAANSFLALKISFANEIANISERVGADVQDIMHGIGLDHRIGERFLNAGIGWGGSCFAKDIQSLLHTAREYGYQAKILEASLEVNSLQRHQIIQKLQERLFILKGRTIALLGLSFKPDTDDLRDAPSLEIAGQLLAMGARVKAYDPIAMDACKRQYGELQIHYSEDAMDALRDADAMVLLTEWPEFGLIDLSEAGSVMARRVLVDGRNLYDPEAARAAGFDYCCIGRAQCAAWKARAAGSQKRAAGAESWAGEGVWHEVVQA
jgi:UDPglucose 6-dehydrogenase